MKESQRGILHLYTLRNVSSLAVLPTLAPVPHNGSTSSLVVLPTRTAGLLTDYVCIWLRRIFGLHMQSHALQHVAVMESL